MANGGTRTPLIPKFHAENCLVKAKEQSASLRVDVSASSRKVPPRLLEENPYRSGWRPPGWGRLNLDDHGIAVEVHQKSAASDMGQKRRFRDVRIASALTLKADIHPKVRHVSKVPTGDIEWSHL